jgi:hypothetical protein
MSDATLLTDRTRPAVRLERRLPDPPELVLGHQDGPPEGYKGKLD